MTKNIVEQTVAANRRMIHWLASFVLALVALAAITGCQSEKPVSSAPGKQSSVTNEVVTLREGDVLKISFPGSPTLDTVKIIRDDGFISLPLVGDVKAAGETPDALDQKLIELYSPQLMTKQVTVEVQSSAFPVYITGAVLRPGKIMSIHPITALEAVMEAGGFNYATADMKHVVVIRKEAGGTKNYTLNLKAVMDGKTGAPFYLKPEDIVFVQEKFNWF
jgi:polysaccharide biosynthesis/export protein